MRRSSRFRVTAVAAVAATLIVQLWLPAAHTGVASDDAVAAASADVAGGSLDGSVHDQSSCPICLALRHGRSALEPFPLLRLLQDPPALAALGEPSPTLVAPPELASGSPRAPPARPLVLG